MSYSLNYGKYPLLRITKLQCSVQMTLRNSPVTMQGLKKNKTYILLNQRTPCYLWNSMPIWRAGNTTPSLSANDHSLGMSPLIQNFPEIEIRLFYPAQTRAYYSYTYEWLIHDSDKSDIWNSLCYEIREEDSFLMFKCKCRHITVSDLHLLTLYVFLETEWLILVLNLVVSKCWGNVTLPEDFSSVQSV